MKKQVIFIILVKIIKFSILYNWGILLLFIVLELICVGVPVILVIVKLHIGI